MRYWLPTRPGRFYWSEWAANVEVVQRNGKLFVTPPCRNAIEVSISVRIAGKFEKERK